MFSIQIWNDWSSVRPRHLSTHMQSGQEAEKNNLKFLWTGESAAGSLHCTIWTASVYFLSIWFSQQSHFTEEKTGWGDIIIHPQEIPYFRTGITWWASEECRFHSPQASGSRFPGYKKWFFLETLRTSGVRCLISHSGLTSLGNGKFSKYLCPKSRIQQFVATLMMYQAEWWGHRIWDTTAALKKCIFQKKQRRMNCFNAATYGLWQQEEDMKKILWDYKAPKGQC